MSLYKRMRVAELQQACEMNGIDFDGLNKKGLIRALQAHSTQEVQAGERGSEQTETEPDDSEVSFRRPTDTTGNGENAEGLSALPGARQGESAGAEALSLLELKLALAREERERIREEKEKTEREWEIERERRELGMGPNPTHSNNGGMRSDISRLLPRMPEGEPLVFFSAFE